MKIIVPKNSTHMDTNLLGDMINSHLEPLLLDKRKNKQKILELCHVGKFLMFFEKEIRIEKLSEKPDFILEWNRRRIGLEHQIIIEPKSKEREGFYENIFSSAELEIQSDPELPNFLANCYLHHDLNFKLRQKENLISLVKEIVKDYVLNENFTENPLIEHISKMPHTQKNINANLGAWWQKDITKELIHSAIRKKDKKILKYNENNVDSQWLLLVIGGVGDSSYNMDTSMEINIETPFDKVFILEDFRTKLFEIK